MKLVSWVRIRYLRAFVLTRANTNDNQKMTERWVDMTGTRLCGRRYLVSSAHLDKALNVTLTAVEVVVVMAAVVMMMAATAAMLPRSYSPSFSL